MDQKKKKLEKKKKKRKLYEKKRNVAIIERKKLKSEGGMKIELNQKKKVFCQECKYAKKNKTGDRKMYYCGIFDKENYDKGLIPAMGDFEGNKEGSCPRFKKRLFKIK